MTSRNKEFQERLEKFVFNCISLANHLSATPSNKQIQPQFIDSATSFGANYHEACEAESSRDFIHKMKIARKEGKETDYWLRMLSQTNAPANSDISVLQKECDELIKIFSSIINKFTQPRLSK